MTAAGAHAALARSVANPKATLAAAPLARVDRLEDLDVIRNKDVDAAIWDRAIPTSMAAQLAALLDRDLAHGRFRVAIGEVAWGMTDHMGQWGWGDGAAQRWLAHDVAALAAQFARILDVGDVTVRVERVRSDACRKFHRDTLRARLICTYSGPGTELGMLDDADQPRRIGVAPTGAPCLLKGKLWPEAPQRAIVHRSPPIEHVGDARLVVVLDAASVE